MFLGELAAIGTSVCWAATSIFFTLGGRQVGSIVVNRSRLLLAVLIIPIIHLFLEGTLLPLHAEPFRWGWLGLSSVLGLVLGDSLLFQAFVTVGPRLSQIMMSLVPIFSTFLAWVLFGETVSQQEFAGIALAVGGVAWVVSEPRNSSGVAVKHYGRGILLALGGALGQATGLIASRLGLVGDFSPLSANLIRILIAAGVLWGITAVRGQARFTIDQLKQRRVFPAILGGTIAGPVLGVWLSLIAIQLARVGIASTLMSLAPLILIPIGHILFKERVTARSVIGTLIALVGVALIFWE